MGKKRKRRRRARRAAAAPVPAATAPPAPTPEARRRRKWRPATLATMALVVALAAGAAVWLGRSAGGPHVVEPRHAEGMDPGVRDLVERTIGQVREAPENAEAHGELGLVYAANHLWPEAREAFARAAELDPGDHLWRYHESLAARQAGEVEEALELLRELTASAPSFAPAWQRLGEALLHAGDLEGAQAAHRRVIELEPSAPDGYVGVAEVLIHERRHEEALALLQRALALDPSFQVSHYLLGLAYRGLGDAEKAEPHLARGLNAPRRYLSDPYTERIEGHAVNLTSQLARAGLKLRAGDAAGAIVILEEALRARPDELRVMNPLAMAYMQTNQLERARDLLLRAHELAGGELASDELAVEMNLASAHLRLGDFDEALRWADTAVERAPEVAQTHVARAFALDRLGRLREAVAAARRAAELDANDPRIRQLAEQLEARAGGGS